MSDVARTQRVGEEFREILAEEIPKLKDPRVGFVTVVGVRVSPDLRHAWVAYTSMGDENVVWFSPDLGIWVKANLRRNASHPAGPGSRDDVLLSQNIKR